MRRLLVASILGVALATPAFAADAADTPARPLATGAAVAAAASNSRAANVAAERADLAYQPSYNFRRPSLLPALYATSAALQGYDTYSTMTALKRGGREANPVMKAIVQNPVAFVAVKASVTTASVMAAEQLWKNNHRMGAIGLMIASNIMMGTVAAHNARVLTSLK